MPAPPTDLVAALRAGTVSRHVFFYMSHVDGPVRAWDGIGDFTLSGNTYKGVAGFMNIQGVSDSGDVQNHQIEATLNGVELATVNVTTLNIRNELAELYFGWLDEAGGVLANRTVFSGLGDILRTKFTVDEHSVTAMLRAPLAEWRTPPRAYYTDADQQRRFPGDTGFSFVKLLENVSVSGWSKDPEASGGIPTQVTAGGFFANSITGNLIGANGWGLTAFCYNSTPLSVRALDSSTIFLEETSLAAVSASARAVGGTMQVGGINAYIDLSGVVRSAGGKKIQPSGVTAQFLREQAAITSVGTAGATTLTAFTGASQTFFKKTGSSQAYPAADMSNLVYDNSGLANALGDSGTTSGTLKTGVGGTPWVEETTGNAVTYSGGLLKCNGNNVVVSTTNALITSGGKKVVLQGSTNAKQFLRVWA